MCVTSRALNTDAIMGSEGYSTLKDLRVEIDGKEGTFSLCFWVYLMRSTTFPATIIQQVKIPFFFCLLHKRSSFDFCPTFSFDENGGLPS